MNQDSVEWKTTAQVSTPSMSAARSSSVCYFISGHRDLKPEEFKKHYTDKIDAALKDESSKFVVGSACGADDMAFEYIWQKIPKETRASRVAVFVYERNPSEQAQRLQFFKDQGVENIKTGFFSYTHRDAEMTKVSTVDIAWVRAGKTASGTAMNLKRREKSARQ